jgi:adenylylsulfate kinase-like enzyme
MSNVDGEQVPVLNIIGPVGVGKSSAAEAVSALLNRRAVAHAVIDLDFVRQVYPAPPSDPFQMAVGFKNLAAVWANYRAAGARCLIIPSVMESTDDFEKIAKAIPAAAVFIVRLTAPLEVNHARIRGRETTPESMAWHLNRATQLDRELSEKQLEHVTIDTDAKTPAEIAGEILNQWSARAEILRGPADGLPAYEASR